MPTFIRRFQQLGRPAQILIGTGALAVVAVVALITASLPGGTSTTTTTSEPTTTTAPPPPAPLTGVPEHDPEVFSRAAITVKIGNNPEARPQSGLDVADVVYEEEVEGRITRFLAVFHSQAPKLVGPIRSIRLMDGPIASQVGGIFVHGGGENVPERVARLEAAGLEVYGEGGLVSIGAHVLDRSHSNGVRPNILFADTARIWAAAKTTTPPRPLFLFRGAGEDPGGDPVETATVPVGNGGFQPTWRWDASEGVWKRFSGGEPFLAKSGRQVSAHNVIVQFVRRVGEESIVVGEGEAAVLTAGRIIRGRWVRPTLADTTRFLDLTGREIRLSPGRTWVELPLAGGTIDVG